MLTREQTVTRAAREIGEHASVRLGPGLAGLDAHLPEDARYANGESADVVLVSASEVSEQGDLRLEEDLSEGSELLRGSARVVAVLPHVTGDGAPRIVRECGGPPLARAAVHRIVTDLAVLDVTDEGLRIRELAPNVSAREVQEQTEPTLLAGPDLRPIDI
jgi:3-oxoacid CoA-transferase subunit B